MKKQVRELTSDLLLPISSDHLLLFSLLPSFFTITAAEAEANITTARGAAAGFPVLGEGTDGTGASDAGVVTTGC